MVLISSMLQSGLQALMRPAIWIPGIRSLHEHKECWTTNISAEDCLEKTLLALGTLIKTDKKGTFYDVHQIDRVNKFLRIFVFTWAEWLDVIEIKYFNGMAVVHSFSTGLFPTSVPFSFLLNVVFCFAPFSDVGFNKERIENLRQAMPDVNIQIKS